MNLHVTRIGEIGPFLVGHPRGGGIASHCIGRKEVDIPIAACCQHDSVCAITLNFSGDHVAGNNPACLSVDDHKIEHLVAGMHFYGPLVNLTIQCGICTKQKLLPCLTAGIKGPANQNSSERTVGEGSAVFACKWNSLGHTLVDDIWGDFSQAVNISFTGSVIATLDGIIEKAVH